MNTSNPIVLLIVLSALPSLTFGQSVDSARIGIISQKPTIGINTNSPIGSEKFRTQEPSKSALLNKISNRNSGTGNESLNKGKSVPKAADAKQTSLPIKPKE